MTRRELKKEAYRMIVKENNSHQQTFDALRKDAKNGIEELAEDIAAIPSNTKQEQNKALLYTYIISLGVVILLRVLGVLAIFDPQKINGAFILLIVALGVLVPAGGIYGALSRRHETYRTIGILLILSIVRAVSKGEISPDPFTFIFLIPTIVAIALAFYLPTRLKTKFSKKTVQEEVDGKLRKRFEVTFEKEEQDFATDLLDANL